MANLCFGYLTVSSNEATSDGAKVTDDQLLPVLEARLKALSYDDFMPYIYDGRLEVDCGFRWYPPFDALRALSEEYCITIHCRYNEPTSSFRGTWCAVNGAVTTDKYVDY